MRWIVLLLLAFSMSSTCQAPLSHEPLRYKNTFKTPEEVVRYYCMRDASGFVWSGLLDVERKAFTLWESTPATDSFFVARSLSVGSAEFTTSTKSEARVDVAYELVGISDGQGSKMPAPKEKRVVSFLLKKVGGQWKIARPAVQDVASVVLETHFSLKAD